MSGLVTVQLVHGLVEGLPPVEPPIFLQGAAFGPHLTSALEHAFVTKDEHAAQMAACLLNRVWPNLWKDCIWRATPVEITNNKNGRTP